MRQLIRLKNRKRYAERSSFITSCFSHFLIERIVNLYTVLHANLHTVCTQTCNTYYTSLCSTYCTKMCSTYCTMTCIPYCKYTCIKRVIASMLMTYFCLFATYLAVISSRFSPWPSALQTARILVLSSPVVRS